MSTIGFTKEQEKAIDTNKCDLLVSAAAGSGKTAVLVERIIRTITNKEKPVDIDRLLVVTFTDAAASEMRQRILKAINDMIKQQPDNEHLKRQEMLMNRASITTIHSFCLRIIRKYFYLIDIDPNFRIIDMTEADLLKTETMRNLFEELYDNDNTSLFEEVFNTRDNIDFLRLVEAYGDKVKDDKLQMLALQVYDFVQSCPWPEKWLEEFADKLIVNNIEDIEKSDWYSYFISDTQMALNGALSAVDIAIDMCDNYEINPLAIDTLLDDKEKISNIINSIDNGFESLYDSMQFSFSTLRLSLPKKKGEEESEELKAYKKEISDLRTDEIKAPIINIQKKVMFMQPQDILNTLRESQKDVKTLCNIVIAFSRKFYNIKRARNIADFSDFEHLCINALVMPGSTEDNIIPSVAALELREKYEEVLMDEYQDSNLVQEFILSSIARQDGESKNRFMVGDIKQSIYKFRMANPELFRQKYNSYSLDGNGFEKRIDLARNFRSRKSVLDGINFIFKQIMSEDLGEVTYDNSAALYYGADYPQPQEESVDKVEIMLMEMANKSNESETTQENIEIIDDNVYEENNISTNTSDDIIKDLSNAEWEAKMVAAKIKELITGNADKKPFQVAQRDKSFRNIELQDIVILLRSTKNIAEAYVRELKKQDIIAFSDSSSGYFEAIEIMTIISLLRTIDNPRQDIHLISVLYSTIYMLTPDELIAIRQALPKGMFIDCIDQYILDENSDIVIKNKLIKFKADLKVWREKSIHYAISDLLQLIFEDTGYFDYVGTMQGGKVRQANLTALFERAVKYEQTKLKGLFHFIRYIEKMQKNKAEFGNANVMSENDNLVRIMSIHKSKGLEFPVVFVCGLGRNFNLRDASSELLLHQKLGFGPMLVDSELRVKYNTIARYAISRKITIESLSEEMRILYVALTRAKEKLILTSCMKGIDKKIKSIIGNISDSDVSINPYKLAQKKTFMDWILFSAIRHRDIINDLDINEDMKYVSSLHDDESRWGISIINKPEIEIKDKDQQAINQEIIQELKSVDISKKYSDFKDDIQKNLSYRYKNKLLSEIPSKISITEIKRINYESQLVDSLNFDEAIDKKPVLEFRKPEFIEMRKKEESAAKKGTLLHTVMEYLDLNVHSTRQDIENLISKLEEKGIFTEDDVALIDINKIMGFIQSDIAKRIKSSAFVSKEIPFVLGVSPYDIDKRWKDASDETILVHGIIDCIFDDNGEIVLLDYKSDAVNRKTVKSVANRYKIQLDIYKRAIEANTGKKIKESLIYFFNLNDCYRL